VLGAAIVIAALALTVEAVLAVVQRAVTPRGLKLNEKEDVTVAIAPLVTETA
jgi:ABC-type proline/glycine betaine transport system permease subunit